MCVRKRGRTDECGCVCDNLFQVTPSKDSGRERDRSGTLDHRMAAPYNAQPETTPRNPLDHASRSESDSGGESPVLQVGELESARACMLCMENRRDVQF